MMNINRSDVMWAWVCPVTGIVLTEGWGATLDYAKHKSIDYFGKRRIALGDFKAIRVTLEVLPDEEADKLRAEFEAWKAAKAAKAAGSSQQEQEAVRR